LLEEERGRFPQPEKGVTAGYAEYAQMAGSGISESKRGRGWTAECQEFGRPGSDLNRRKRAGGAAAAVERVLTVFCRAGRKIDGKKIEDRNKQHILEARKSQRRHVHPSCLREGLQAVDFLWSANNEKPSYRVDDDARVQHAGT
jgi:hypothetical protein